MQTSDPIRFHYFAFARRIRTPQGYSRDGRLALDLRDAL